MSATCRQGEGIRCSGGVYPGGGVRGLTRRGHVTAEIIRTVVALRGHIRSGRHGGEADVTAGIGARVQVEGEKREVGVFIVDVDRPVLDVRLARVLRAVAVDVLKLVSVHRACGTWRNINRDVLTALVRHVDVHVQGGSAPEARSVVRRSLCIPEERDGEMCLPVNAHRLA